MASKKKPPPNKRARKVMNRQRRLAEQEAARERHTRLVVERSGDPRFIQQTATSTGRKLSWTDQTVGAEELQQAFREQREAFIEKFGREPGPDDPLLFDPNSGTPQELTQATIDADIDQMIENISGTDINPAYLMAFKELGYLVTEVNQHLFSAADLELWNETVDFYWVDDEEAAAGSS
ncbi:hypothetical protein [Rhodococcus sp. NPDC060176]|uniref:hypothetical protein n=1 Tax=unclassified Rhodococcus (in: high G+C Gram-positive bacteria) TaxID=192944 RepID=UPI0036535B50